MEVHDVCFFNINKPDPSDIVASRAIDKPDYICHFGILGMKWGVRRYQNEDGTLTEEGKRRYYDDRGKLKEKYRNPNYLKRDQVAKSIYDKEKVQQEIRDSAFDDLDENVTEEFYDNLPKSFKSHKEKIRFIKTYQKKYKQRAMLFAKQNNIEYEGSDIEKMTNKIIEQLPKNLETIMKHRA